MWAPSEPASGLDFQFYNLLRKVPFLDPFFFAFPEMQSPELLDKNPWTKFYPYSRVFSWPNIIKYYKINIRQG